VKHAAIGYEIQMTAASRNPSQRVSAVELEKRQTRFSGRLITAELLRSSVQQEAGLCPDPPGARRRLLKKAELFRKRSRQRG